MDLRKVVLYYPNRWRRNLKGEVPDEDLKFNWFLCSKRYRDSGGNDVIDVSTKYKFYDDVTGDTLVVGTKPCILLIDGSTPDDETIRKIKNGGYQGMVSTMGCVKETCCEDFICKEVNFFFKKGVLVSPRKQECEILEYSKRNYKTISKYVAEFPTPEEVEEVLKEYPCSTACKVLYQYITEYFRLTGKE